MNLLFPAEIMRDTDAERVYQEYPRKVAKEDALRSIRKALHKIEIEGRDIEWLIGRVRQFANSPAGKAGKYTPHPATWFNRGSYDDDPTEWRRGYSNSPHADDVERCRVREGEARARKEAMEKKDKDAIAYTAAMSAREQYDWLQRYIEQLPEVTREWYRKKRPAELVARPIIALWIMEARNAASRTSAAG